MILKNSSTNCLIFLLIKFIRLNTNEDLISVVSHEKTIIQLQNPLVINFDPTMKYIMLVPWVSPSFVNEQTFYIKTSEIVTMSEPSTKLISLYYATLEAIWKPISLQHEEHDPLNDISDEEKKAFQDYLKDYLRDLNRKS